MLFTSTVLHRANLLNDAALLHTNHLGALQSLELDAGSLSGKKTFNNWVGSSDTSDVYEFNLDVAGHYSADPGTQLQLSVYGMSADADIRLVRDSNGNFTLDWSDEVITTSTNSGSLSEYINLSDVKSGNYFVEVYQYSGNTNYTLEMNTPNVAYTFTYNYGDGEYYKGYGYTQSGENFYTGQVINQSSPNETGYTGYYVIDSARPTSLTNYAGQVVVTEYYDKDTGFTADMDSSGGEAGHLHDNSLTWKFGTGNSGLGSESGLAHIDNHTYGFDKDTFAVFNNFREADLIPQQKDVAYTFTYYYGDGEYYQGYGYTKLGEEYYAGQRINQSSANETGYTGYYIINSAEPTSRTSYRGEVVVTKYYDKDSGLIADSIPNGGEPGHLHDKDLQWNFGRGNSGLGSESGLAHIDGHRYGFDTTSFAVFSNYNEADLYNT
jgi:hypothetical protein